MIKTELTEMVGIKHPIIQAGMGPYSTNSLAAAAANAGALGLISCSGLAMGTMAPQLLERLTGGENGTVYDLLKKLPHRIKEETRKSQGVFGINCMVSAEMVQYAKETIQAVIDARNEDPELADRLRVVVTSAGDPLPWAETIKPSGVKWFHVIPSVCYARRIVFQLAEVAVPRELFAAILKRLTRLRLAPS